MVVSFLLRRMQASVGLAPPTRRMLVEEDHSACPLLRHVPALTSNIAFRTLGDNFPTPVHHGSVVDANGETCRFLAKREDLSSSLYGGNKVRTLQFQLAVIEARLESAEPHTLPVTVLGTYGSNQNVATVVHAGKQAIVGYGGSERAHTRLAGEPPMHAQMQHENGPSPGSRDPDPSTST